MLIPLNEPSNFRYIHINPATNRVHLLVPFFIAGMDVSTDNTCKSDVELRAFFEGGAFNELESYKSTLEFHLSLLEKDNALYRAKKERLEQINLYLEAVVGMRDSYKTIVTGFLSKSSNLYSIQLRPRVQAPMSRVVNPVFTIKGSPFYFESAASPSEKAERLSMLIQFYLGYLNVYCRAKGISDRNFGVILDGSSSLSEELVEIVAAALSLGEEIELAIIAFFNLHKNEFKLSRELNTQDKDAIIQKFEPTYRTVTATKENLHMDDFMFLDTEAQGEHDIFITNKGLICTDAANILPTTPQNEDYLAEIRREARMHRDIVTPQDEPIITIDIAPESLMDKLDAVQWERLPVDIAEACRALPVFKVRELLDDVAKGKQDEAHAILASSEDKQTLLRTPGKFTDYSGRTFHCTAYEYAYWAKDKHMMHMLERHMDDETKAFMLEKIEAQEQVGLSYQQHGITYQNAHYDMSFALKNLNADEFCQLQTMLGQSNSKIQQATIDNYKNISFTATEYEALKKSLEQHRPKGIFSFFYSSPATALSEKLKFDFHSLITALDIYVTNFDKWNYHQQEEAWMKVGQAQRDVPAHVAHEYCRPDRSFDLLPSFTEETLPRILTFYNCVTNIKSWFPLSSSSSGLGFDFALIRWPSHCVWGRDGAGVMAWDVAAGSETAVMRDLAAVRHLDEVRIADLTQSRENLSRPANQLGLGVCRKKSGQRLDLDC